MSESLLLTVNAACALSGMSRVRLYALMGAGALDYVKIGKRRMIRTADLEAFVASLTKGGM